ncbi:L-asparaginase 1-like [Sycon ciliatum]|uniref:L-asparaginase 1-like n=1 Tax=Sycon ciliatum TaxID=27933 RepID=UPI0031F67C37
MERFVTHELGDHDGGRISPVASVTTLDIHVRAHVLVLYTGGTVGMMPGENGYDIRADCFEPFVRSIPLFHDKLLDVSADTESYSHLGLPEPLALPCTGSGQRRIVYTIKEYSPLLDSSNMDMDDWVLITQDIKHYYQHFDGFVILHGTDTMAYTASALSFMLENLGKTVILTGSQIPISETRSDGIDNFLGALMIAGTYPIPEVTLYFHGKLLRGNRAAKCSSDALAAFNSMNIQPLALAGVRIVVEWDLIHRPTTTAKFDVHTKLEPRVGVLRLFPGIASETVRQFLAPPLRGCVLQTYGVGNAPSNREDILKALHEATERDVLIVNCTQCVHGGVVDSYAVGKTLVKAGLISGSDMTLEAALTKLAYVLGKQALSHQERRKLMHDNLRGELTVNLGQLALDDSQFILKVAQVIGVSTGQELKKVGSALFPSLLLAAARSGDIRLMKELFRQGADANTSDADLRSPLHVACAEGHTDMVRYLLERGASVYARDRFGRMPLQDAIWGKHADVVQLLRKTGAHLQLGTAELAHELTAAVFSEHSVSSLEMWCLAGADFNVSDHFGMSPLHTCVMKKDAAAVAYLLSLRVDTQMKNEWGNRPLDEAKRLDCTEIAKLLEEYQES